MAYFHNFDVDQLTASVKALVLKISNEIRKFMTDIEEDGILSKREKDYVNAESIDKNLLENEIGVIYENQNVYILLFDNLTNQYDKEIDGTLYFVEYKVIESNANQKTERYINWKPNEQKTISKDVRPISFNIDNLKSIKRCHMTVKDFSSYMVFFMLDGSQFPMMIFRDGGTRNLMDKLENYLIITNSDSEMHLYLTKPMCERSDMVDNTKEIRDSKYSANPSSFKKQIVAGLANFGANISNQISKVITVDSDSSLIHEILREDAFGIPIENPKLLFSREESGFQIVSKPIRLKFPHVEPLQRTSPLQELEWKKHLTQDGRVLRVEALLEKIFRGGIEMELRPIVWKYLLNYYKYDSSLDENHQMIRSNSKIYQKLNFQWKSISKEQEQRFSVFRERKTLIEKDTIRTDRSMAFYNDENENLKSIFNILMSYSMYNFDLGYAQGMNDVLALVFYLMKDEEDSFWCFVHLMNIMETNFSYNQLNIKKQFRQLFILVQIFDPEFSEYLDSNACREMLFCFRWLLVTFKRDLSYENTMTLWELLWTNYRCKDFHLFFALAILLHEKKQIVENKYSFNDILQHINSLNLNEFFENHLQTAEVLFLKLNEVWLQIPEENREILNTFSPKNGVELPQSVNIANNDSQLKSRPEFCIA